MINRIFLTLFIPVVRYNRFARLFFYKVEENSRKKEEQTKGDREPKKNQRKRFFLLIEKLHFDRECHPDDWLTLAFFADRKGFEPTPIRLSLIFHIGIAL